MIFLAQLYEDYNKAVSPSDDWSTLTNHRRAGEFMLRWASSQEHRSSSSNRAWQRY